MTSPNSVFGSYSALLLLPEARFLAGSDRGALLEFGLGGTDPDLRRIFADDDGSKSLSDLEALTRDPATGRIWAAYEGRNAIIALDADMRLLGRSRPEAMAGWPSNAGPESLVLLSDGSFITIAEGSRSWFADSFPALLFGGDPVSGTAAIQFRFQGPDGFRPVDMAQLPDGQVLILMRKLVLDLPPDFETKLVLAEPQDIASGRIWRGRTIAMIAGDLPTDNYEGMAIEDLEGGKVAIWLISDDNGGMFQRTLLLQLLWELPNRPAE
nr:esterase-like activity of phytase family protein [Alteripontixanthobacter muriae]